MKNAAVALNFVKQTRNWLIYITIPHYGDGKRSWWLQQNLRRYHHRSTAPESARQSPCHLRLGQQGISYPHPAVRTLICGHSERYISELAEWSFIVLIHGLFQHLEDTRNG